MAKTLFDLERSNLAPLADRLAQLDQNRPDREARLNFLKDSFSRLGLPLPQTQEYIETVDCGHLLFLNDAGCTIRLEQAQEHVQEQASHGAGEAGYVDYNSEFILQPLGRIDGPGISLCVYPGLFSPWDEDHVKGVTGDLNKVSAQLLNEKINFFDFDQRGDNIGYLPFSSPEWPRGVAVVIDPGAVSRLTQAVSPVRQALDKMKSLFTKGTAAPDTRAPVRQSELYAGLRARFAGAMAQEDPHFQSFWTECIAAKNAGLLQASWMGLPHNFKDIPPVAEAYERRVRAQAPAFNTR
jgi:hypothetical protein